MRTPETIEKAAPMMAWLREHGYEVYEPGHAQALRAQFKELRRMDPYTLSELVTIAENLVAYVEKARKHGAGHLALFALLPKIEDLQGALEAMKAEQKGGGS